MFFSAFLPVIHSKPVIKIRQQLFPLAYCPEFTLPDDQYRPAQLPEPGVGCRIACLIGTDLVLPEFGVRFGHDEVPAALVPVPETAVDEYDRPVLGKNDVRMPGKPSVVLAEPQPPAEKISAHQNLRPGILAVDE